MYGPWRHYARWNKSNTNTLWSHLYLKSKKKKKKKDWGHRHSKKIGGYQSVEWEGGKQGEGGEKVQASIYKISQTWGCNVPHNE